MPILDPNSFEFISRSAEQTRRVGMRLGALLGQGDIIALVGDLGAGKTTFVQGVAVGWGSTDSVSSPTYVLVNVYRRTDGEQFAHMDAYRLSGAVEADMLDLDDLIAQGPLVVEWAPRIMAALPEHKLTIRMDYIEEERRQLHFAAEGDRYQMLLDQLKEEVFGV